LNVVEGGNMSGDSLDHGGPFFPTQKDPIRPTGISVRDWLAGLAMQGLLASGEISVSHEVTAEKAYKYADALIREGKD
jgi:hypothetical protein